MVYVTSTTAVHRQYAGAERAVFARAQATAPCHDYATDYATRDPRVAVTVVDSRAPFRTVTVRGRVVEQRGPERGSTEHIDKLATKYLGRERYPLRDGEARVLLRIKPTHVIERGTGQERDSRFRSE